MGHLEAQAFHLTTLAEQYNFKRRLKFMRNDSYCHSPPDYDDETPNE